MDKGGLKTVLVVLFVLLVLGLIAFYWMMPFNSIDFFPSSGGNSNFSLDSSIPSEMQFYPNLRYPSSEISYDIDMSLCTLKKQDDMLRAFEIIENLTVLDFYPDNSNPDIAITCDDKVVVQKEYFVAGEGGPVNITRSGDLNVITEGKILLLKESNCENPNVATHELLHSLGFNHSTNRNNILYPVTSCGETIGEDIPEWINELYSIPSYSDLSFGETSAKIDGRYLDTNITILNVGLIRSGSAELVISSSGDEITRQDISSLDVGSGITYFFGNIRLENTDIDGLDYRIEASFSEIDKANNQIELKIKN